MYKQRYSKYQTFALLPLSLPYPFPPIFSYRYPTKTHIGIPIPSIHLLFILHLPFFPYLETKEPAGNLQFKLKSEISKTLKKYDNASRPVGLRLPYTNK